jgi:tetratricopeptide (TPR) repeat protein
MRPKPASGKPSGDPTMVFCTGRKDGGPTVEMARIEKTVFISYRRTNVPWALAVYQSLASSGYDVFLDIKGIASGDFERVILENIRARAHFLVLLTPFALEEVGEPGDWLRREIETALDTRRNIVPLMLEGFDFYTPSIAKHLTGTLSVLPHYNALRIPPDYFEEAMRSLRERYLAVPLDAVLHPASTPAVQAGREQQRLASAAPPVTAPELKAEECFQRAFQATDPDEQLRYYDEAIRLKPDYAIAYNNRGLVRKAKGDLDGALKDCDEAIRLKPDLTIAYSNRGNARKAKNDLDGALKDHDEAIRLKPDLALAYNNRGIVREAKGDLDGALKDCDEAIRLEPDYAEAHNTRGTLRQAMGDLEGALKDYDEAIRLRPDHADAHYNRGVVRQAKDNLEGAINDYQRYLDLGGGPRRGNQAQVEGIIRDLKGRARRAP